MFKRIQIQQIERLSIECDSPDQLKCLRIYSFLFYSICVILENRIVSHLDDEDNDERRHTTV